MYEQFACPTGKLYVVHSTENLEQIFPEMKLGGLAPNFYIHESVSDLYNPMISSPIFAVLL